MPMMEVEVSIAANTRNANVLTGELFERPDFDALLDLFDTGSAAGLRRTLYVGRETVTERSIVNTQNRLPIVPDDLAVENVEVYAGSQLKLAVENTTAGALTYRAKLRLVEAVEG